MNKFVLASLLGAAVMFAGQAPATSSKAQTSSQPAPATTTKAKKHHKKVKTAPATSTNATSKPAAKQ
jgi:hypothetical protein